MDLILGLVYDKMIVVVSNAADLKEILTDY